MSTILEALEAGDAARCLTLLQQSQTDINDKDDDGATVLHLALLHHLDEVVAAVLARPDFSGRGTQTTYTKESPLHIAAALGNLSAVTDLLRTATAEQLNARDRASYTALHLAVRGEHVDIVAELLGRGDLNRDATDRHGWRAIDQANARCSSRDGRTIRLLLLGAGAPERKEVHIVGTRPVPESAEALPEELRKYELYMSVFPCLASQDGLPMGFPHPASQDCPPGGEVDHLGSESASASDAAAAPEEQAGPSTSVACGTSQPKRRTRRGRGGQRRWAAGHAQQSGDQPNSFSIPDTNSDLFFPVDWHALSFRKVIAIAARFAQSAWA